jgi:hypothetical protein
LHGGGCRFDPGRLQFNAVIVRMQRLFQFSDFRNRERVTTVDDEGRPDRRDEIDLSPQIARFNARKKSLKFFYDSLFSVP